MPAGSKPERAPVPVLVVGNLVAGGAGKTPTVIALVQALRAGRLDARRDLARPWPPAATTRRPCTPTARAATVGDEPLLIHLRTRAPVWVARRRIDAARALCAAHAEVDVLVADDGLQHLALARDVQVIVFDERGVGNGLLLPAGPLRQPLPAHVPVNTPCALQRRAAQHRLARRAWRSARLAGAVPLAGLVARRRRHACRHCRRCAIARCWLRPAWRRRSASSTCCATPGWSSTPCPCPTTTPSISLPWPADGAEVLVTEKDAVKLPRQRRRQHAHLGRGARLPAARGLHRSRAAQPAPDAYRP